MEATTAGPVPLHQLLRARTAAAHARLDAGFTGGFRDARAYDAYLGAMARFLDHAIAVIGAEAWLLDARAALAADLGQPAPLTAPAPAEGDVGRLAGWRYVVAGATLGARVLLRQASALDDGAHLPRTRFLSTFSSSDAWPHSLALLRAAGFDPQARARACEAALEAFAAAEAAFQPARNPAHAA